MAGSCTRAWAYLGAARFVWHDFVEVKSSNSLPVRGLEGSKAPGGFRMRDAWAEWGVVGLPGNKAGVESMQVVGIRD